MNMILKCLNECSTSAYKMLHQLTTKRKKAFILFINNRSFRLYIHANTRMGAHNMALVLALTVVFVKSDVSGQGNEQVCLLGGEERWLNSLLSQWKRLSAGSAVIVVQDCWRSEMPISAAPHRHQMHFPPQSSLLWLLLRTGLDVAVLRLEVWSLWSWFWWPVMCGWEKNFDRRTDYMLITFTEAFVSLTQSIRKKYHCCSM